MKRRNFLRGCLAVTALAILPVPDLHAYPILYGDGAHDDTEALQALLDLKPYVCEGELIKGQVSAHISDMSFRITDTITIRNDYTIMERFRIKLDKKIDGPMMIIEGDNCCLRDGVIDSGSNILSSASMIYVGASGGNLIGNE